MKDVNDNYGHQAGDGLLMNLAGLLQQCCRETDVVARYGGDEFVVFMPDTDAEGARRVVLKVEAALARHNATATGAARLSASTGTHTAGPDDMESCCARPTVACTPRNARAPTARIEGGLLPVGMAAGTSLVVCAPQRP